MRRIAVLSMVLAACGGGGMTPHDSGPRPDSGPSTVPPGESFPASSTIYADISGAPVDSESQMIMNALAANGWGDGLGIDVSFNIFNADPSVARRPFENSGDDPDCDTAPVPLVPGGNTEGNDDYHCADGGDCHYLVYQGPRLYELYQADVSDGTATGGTFSGSCLAVWDLTHDYWQPHDPPMFSRGDHCNGADAADLPMAALILTSADVTSGHITHAMRFTIHSPVNIRADVYVHPATHIGGGSGGNDQLPFGARLRLRGDYDLSQLESDEARTVARALQTYGMFLADGGNLYLSATVDVADVVGTSSLRDIPAIAFEMVEGGPRINWHDYECMRTVVTD